MPSPDWSVFDLLIKILTPSETNSRSSQSIETNSDLLNPPANPIRMIALSLIILSSDLFTLLIALIISFNSLEIPVFKEEVFGPVIAIYRFYNNENIIKLANQTEYGLGASIWSKDINKIKKCKKEINSGAIFINGMTKSDPRIPFGGIKKSGYGRELSSQGLKEFVNIKTIVMNNKELI